jgi:hypothetical protein
MLSSANFLGVNHSKSSAKFILELAEVGLVIVRLGFERLEIFFFILMGVIIAGS